MHNPKSGEEGVASGGQSESSHGGRSSRLTSLDALRGFDMFWIVGASGLVYALNQMADSGLTRFLLGQLEHKDWEGFAFYDLIFPLFVFITGVSLVYSLTKSLAQESRIQVLLKVAKRAFLLYLLGLFYYGGFSDKIPDIRWVGVLQRIAFSYLVASTLFMFLKPKGMIVSCVAILLGYWGLLSFVPVPGGEAGNFEEGKNMVNYVDSAYLPGYKWDGDWDPEGLLSNVPAVATCLLGVFAGFLIRSSQYSDRKKVGLLIGGGGILVAVGFLWGAQFPVIKKIWTSSYVLVAGGYSAVLLGGFYYLIDVLKWKGWAAPFVWIGLNPITVYLVNSLVGFQRLAERLAGGKVKVFLNDQIAQGVGDLVVSLVGLALVFLFCRFLHRRKIYLRL